MHLSRRTLGITLVVSLAVNLFLAGFLVASAVNHGWRGHDRGPSHRRLALRHAFDELDGDARKQAEEQWRAAFPQIREKLREVKRAHRAFRQALDKADPDAVDAAARRIHEARGEAREAVHRTLRRIADGLSPDQREKFYKAVFERRGWKRQHRKRDRDGNREGDRPSRQ